MARTAAGIRLHARFLTIPPYAVDLTGANLVVVISTILKDSVNVRPAGQRTADGAKQAFDAVPHLEVVAGRVRQGSHERVTRPSPTVTVTF